MQDRCGVGSRQVCPTQERGELLRGRAGSCPWDAVTLQLQPRGHVGSVRASAVLGKAIPTLLLLQSDNPSRV